MKKETNCFGNYGRYDNCTLVIDGKRVCAAHSSCERETKVRVRNRLGVNKYKKNRGRGIKVITQEQLFMEKDKGEQYKDIKDLGNKIWREGKELFKLKKQFNMMNRVFFGFDFKEEE